MDQRAHTTPPFWATRSSTSATSPWMRCSTDRPKSLFRLSWVRSTAGADYERRADRAYAPLRRMQADMRSHVPHAEVIYGYFPCHRRGRLLVYDITTSRATAQGRSQPQPLVRFTFARHRTRAAVPRRYYAPVAQAALTWCRCKW